MFGGAFLVFLVGCSTPAQKFQKQLSGGGKVYLPNGVLELSRPLEITPGVRNLELIGSKDTVIRASPEFQGTAFIRCRSCKNVRLRGFVLEEAIATPPCASGMWQLAQLAVRR